MSDQLSDAKSMEPAPKALGLAEALRLSYSTVSPNIRRVGAGVLLGACIALIVAMLSLGTLDTALRVALAAFGFGIPFLLLGLALSLVDLEAAAMDSLRSSLQVAFIAVESYGLLTLLIGIGALLWHFGSGFVLVLVAGVITSLILFVVYTSTFER